jgi:hypothetical protein
LRKTRKATKGAKCFRGLCIFEPFKLQLSRYIGCALPALSSAQGHVAVRLVEHPHFSWPCLLQQLPHHLLSGNGVMGHDTPHEKMEFVDCLTAGGVATKFLFDKNSIWVHIYGKIGEQRWRKSPVLG